MFKQISKFGDYQIISCAVKRELSIKECEFQGISKKIDIKELFLAAPDIAF